MKNTATGILPFTDRKDLLVKTFSDPELVMSGDVINTGIKIGLPNQKPYVHVVPCLAPLDKCPIAFIEVDGYYSLVTYRLSSQMNRLRGINQRDTEELDVLQPINALLKSDDITIVAYGAKGGRLSYDAKRREFIYGIDAVQIARVKEEKPEACANDVDCNWVEVEYRDRSYWVTVLDAAKRKMDHASFEAFANGFVPVLHKKIMDRMRQSGGVTHKAS